MTQSLFDETRCQMVCLLGTNGAGKSSTLNLLKNNTFTNIQSTPIVNFQTHTWISQSNETNHLRIWDCSGFPQISKLTGLHVKRSHAVLVFYNCYLKNTFEDLDLWIDLALSKNIPINHIWIVRTEFIKEGQELSEQKQLISQSEGIAFSQKRKLNHFTIKEYTQQNIEHLYQGFGNYIINEKVKLGQPELITKKSVQYIEKSTYLQTLSNLDTLVYFSVSSIFFGYLAFNFSKNN